LEGDRRGRLLGFPTANIVPNSDKALPPDGVYVTRAILGSRVYKSVTNIGVRPTFDGGKRLIEVYLLDFEDGEFYGEELQIELVERLRGEVRFANVEELKAQMANDVKEAERILAREEDARVRERSG
jgi:riboflavin kinase/FMN adenylyltransferase